ncbi:RNA polymerase sigma factor [Microbacterium sp. NPDC089320]|uniref:RNA polymerase sigma factor n=1 Tax=Microbacterium sp. NPDC089320 TaxID=3155182 RepID=UPI00341B07E7
MTPETRLTAALQTSSADLLAYLSRRVGTDDAADLLGETMVVAWRRSADVPDEPERARMWLFGVARGTLANHARGQRRKWALADRLRLHLRESNDSPPADDGLEVRDAIARLAPDLAEVVRLVHWERLSLAQAAEHLGVPSSTARGRYARAKEQLRAELAIGAAPGAESGAGFA